MLKSSENALSFLLSAQEVGRAVLSLLAMSMNLSCVSHIRGRVVLSLLASKTQNL